MFRIHAGMILLAVFVTGQAWCADDKQAQDDGPKLVEKLMQRFSQVVAKDIEEKLQLSDEQKAKLAKIQKELDSKNQKLFLRATLKATDLQDALEKKREQNDGEDLKTEALDITMFTLEIIKTQRDSDAKFRAILTDDQKKTYDELKHPVRTRRQQQR